MFATNPFATLPGGWSAAAMQAFVVLMVLAVIAGTLYDIAHKGSARYFFAHWRRSRGKGTRALGGGELLSIAVRTAAVDVLASGEFCNPRRRIAHLLTMYGFVLYVVSTAVLVFADPAAAAAAPAPWPQLWWLGAAMVCVGGFWFWFFIRADVAAEGRSPFRVMRADLFVLSLLASATLALLWAGLQAGGSAAAGPVFTLYIIATAVLFGSVAWSKFAHMFFKPAAAFEKRVSAADGTRNDLPAPADRPAHFGSARERPMHY